LTTIFEGFSPSSATPTSSSSRHPCTGGTSALR
jgi:hypothetical protein